jgi:hypothetical protein
MTFKAPLEIVANTHIQYSDSRLIRVELMTEKVEYSKCSVQIFALRLRTNNLPKVLPGRFNPYVLGAQY